MKHLLSIFFAPALWATAITLDLFAWVIADDGVGIFAFANILALLACVPTFYLSAECLLARHMESVSQDHRELLADLVEVVGRADAERDVRQLAPRR